MGESIPTRPNNNRMFRSIAVILCLVACVIAKATTKAPPNKIHRIEVFTSDCLQCGMSVLGKITVDIYGQAGKHCNTGLLDNVGKDDFNRGTISKFSDATIGNCNNYDLGNTKAEISMKITHSGSDGGKFNWIQVFSDKGHYQCFFSSNLDNIQIQSIIRHRHQLFVTDTTSY